MRCTRNAVRVHALRGFESHPLRFEVKRALRTHLAVIDMSLPALVEPTSAPASSTGPLPPDSLTTQTATESNEPSAPTSRASSAVTSNGTVSIGATAHYGFAGQRIAYRDSAGLHWLYPDNQGSTAVEVDPTGTVVQQHFNHFGALRATVNPTSDIGYTGERLDDSTGLMFYQARYHEPAFWSVHQP